MFSKHHRSRSLLVVLALMTMIVLVPASIGQAESVPISMTPDKAITELIAGNKRYIERRPQSESMQETQGERKTPEEIPGGQSPFAAVIRCADSRVTPEIVFDQPLGKLFVCGVAGNIPTTEIIASLEYGVAVLGTKVIVVMGHSSCGAVKEAIERRNTSIELPGSLPQLIDQIIVPCGLAADHHQLKEATVCNANMGVQRLMKRSPVIRAAVKTGDLKVISGILDLGTGRFEITRTEEKNDPN